MRGPLHILKEAPGQGREESIVLYVLSVQERLSNVELVKDNLAQAQVKQKQWY